MICILGLILVLLEDVLKIKGAFATITAILVSAGLFAAHHYIGVLEGRITTLEEFKTGSFMFRATAGVYFAVIFRYRGYGITAGTHSAYNIIYFTLC